MSNNNICYAQSGGATAVINATAAGLIQAARQNNDIGKVLVAHNGILGVLHEELIDTSFESDDTIAGLMHTPGSAFGSCRHKLQPRDNQYELRRIFDVFEAHGIRYFFYNGGNDSQDTVFKISEYAKKINYPLTAIGIPKTIDNDLAITDNCPGYASAAKFLATTTQEISLELAGMCQSSTQIFILEVMGRHSGWLAAACGYLAHHNSQSPPVILFPEVPFDPDEFLAHVEQSMQTRGHCMVIAAEGICDQTGRLLCHSNLLDAFGHLQLGGIAPNLAHMVSHQLGYRYHWAVPDYMQRASRHLASATDVEQSIALGKAALQKALEGHNSIMLTLERLSDEPYQWQIAEVALSEVANREKKLPKNYIRDDGYGITDDCQRYLKPLLTGESYPPYQNGLPEYVQLQRVLCEKKITEVYKV